MTSNLRSGETPETHKVEQEVNSLWEVIDQSLELSGYAKPNNEGILEYEVFPNRYTDYRDLEKKALSEKSKYEMAQLSDKFIMESLDQQNDPRYAWYREHI